MRRILALTAALVVLVWGGCALGRMLASDETRIRWMIEDAVEAFNDGKPGSALAPLADDWRDERDGLDKSTLQRLLVATVFQERDPLTKRFAYRVAVQPESLVIAVGGDERATASLEARFSRTRGEEVRPVWTIAVEAKLRVGEDGWEVWRTKHTSLEGRGLSGR